MKVEVQAKQKTENTENNVRLEKDDTLVLSDVNMPFSGLMAQQLNDNNEINDLNIFAVDYTADTMSMNLNDALFFINLAHEGQFSVETGNTGDFKSLIQSDVAQNVVSKKTVEVTNKLVELIETAQKTQKPVRISFDNDVSVVLKIDKHGKVTAEFIPGSAEAENYLRNNIPALKQRFDEQNLPYNELFYRQNRQGRNRNNKNKGE